MKTAMILAAGRGERLRPITDRVPKALCQVNGKPLIEHHVLRLAESGFDRIVINHAHLGSQIRHYLGNGSRYGVEIVYSPEPPGGLETAGGIVKALPLLGKQPFVIVNADIITDFDFKSLLNQTVDYMHLVLVPKDPSLGHFGDFGLVNSHQISNDNRDYTYPGIACLHPQLFFDLQQGRFSITPLLRRYVEEQKASGSVYTGIWFDIGSIERLQAAKTYYQD